MSAGDLLDLLAPDIARDSGELAPYLFRLPPHQPALCITGPDAEGIDERGREILRAVSHRYDDAEIVLDLLAEDYVLAEDYAERYALFPVDPAASGLEVLRPLVSLERRRGRPVEIGIALVPSPFTGNWIDYHYWERNNARHYFSVARSLTEAVNLANQRIRTHQLSDQRRRRGRPRETILQLEPQAVAEHFERLLRQPAQHIRPASQLVPPEPSDKKVPRVP